MNDELEQLLRRADESAPAPDLAPGDLVQRVRRTARNQRRLTACGLAIVPFLVLLPMLSRQQPKPPVVSDARQPVETSTADASIAGASSLDASIHEQTAAIMETRRRPQRRSVDASDAFLVELQMQRDRAALVLLRDAKRSAKTGGSLGVTALRRTIELFPETPAAASAGEELKQLDSSRSQI